MKKSILGAIILTVLVSVSGLSTVQASAAVTSEDGTAVVAPAPVIIPQKVTDLKALVIKTNNITLTWAAQDKGISYQIYSYNTDKKTYKKIGTTANNYYQVKKLQSGVQYKYKVVAYKDTVKAAGATLKVKTAVPQISNLSTKGGSAITLNWKKAKVSGYRIWVYDANKKAYVKKADVDGKSTSFTDNSASSANQYNYRISAYQFVNGKRVYGASSDCSAIKKPDKTTVSSLNQDIVWYHTDDGGLSYYAVITLNWNQVNGATGYQVYMYDNGINQWVQVKDMKSTTYKPADFSSYHTYQYKVRAYKLINGQKIYGSISSVSTTVTKEAGSKTLWEKYIYTWKYGYNEADLDLIVDAWLHGDISKDEALKELKVKFPMIQNWTFKKYSHDQYMQGYNECGTIDITRYFVSVYTGSSNGTYGFFYGR
jgi:fibronectin type 3 domain-containing protein